jgi:hypothetical protein
MSLSFYDFIHKYLRSHGVAHTRQIFLIISIEICYKGNVVLKTTHIVLLIRWNKTWNDKKNEIWSRNLRRKSKWNIIYCIKKVKTSNRIYLISVTCIPLRKTVNLLSWKDFGLENFSQAYKKIELSFSLLAANLILHPIVILWDVYFLEKVRF